MLLALSSSTARYVQYIWGASRFGDTRPVTNLYQEKRFYFILFFMYFFVEKYIFQFSKGPWEPLFTREKKKKEGGKRYPQGV